MSKKFKFFFIFYYFLFFVLLSFFFSGLIQKAWGKTDGTKKRKSKAWGGSFMYFPNSSTREESVVKFCLKRLHE